MRIYNWKIKRVAAAVVALLSTLTLAQAGSDPADFGEWKFFSGTTPRGTNYCSMISAVTDADVGQNIAIKVLDNVEGVVVDLLSDKWKHDQGSSVAVEFDFGDNEPLSVDAYADGQMLDMQLPSQITAPFMLAVAKSEALRVVFPQYNEDAWIIPLHTANIVVRQLIECAKRLQTRG